MGDTKNGVRLFIMTILVRAIVGAEQCSKPADVAFVIDSSSSIWIYDFEKQIQFAQEIVKMFDIGPDKIQVSALTFSEKITIKFHLNAFITKEDVLKNIGKIQHEAGKSTYTHRALAAMRTNLFSESNGARGTVPHICIILTDGEATNKAAAQEEGKLAREAGIKIIAIGIGSQVNKDELRSLVSPPSTENFFYRQSFSDLNSTAFQTLVGQQACKAIETTTAAPITKATTTKPTTTTTTTEAMPNNPPEPVCQGKEADVVFVIDQSSSIWIPHFREQLQFITDIVSRLDIASGKTRVGLVKYSDQATVQFYLNDYQTIADIRKAVLAITSEGGVTNTHLALEKLITEMFTKEHGSRPSVAHIVVLITDGISSKPDLTITTAELVHASGIYVFAIGVGNLTDRAELIQMASQPVDDFMFEVNGYQALRTIEKILAYKTCEVPQGDQAQCSKDIQVDVVFGLQDIGGGDRAYVTEFINNIGRGFDLSSGNVRIAVRENCGSANIDLQGFATTETFASIMSAATYTSLSTLLQSIRLAFGSGPTRINAEKVAILFLTGKVQDIEKASLEAMRLKSIAKVIVVGLGPNVLSDQMKKLASYANQSVPDMTHVFSVNDLKDLPYIIKKAYVLLCKSKPLPLTIVKKLLRKKVL